MLRPVAAAIRACAQSLAAPVSGQHWPGDEVDGGHGRRSRGHELGWQGFVAAAEQHDCVHGLARDHFLSCHGHEVAKEHGGGGEEDLTEGQGRKDEG